MDRDLTATTLRLYRRLRAGHPPEEALELLRDQVRVAREYAIDSERWTMAGELRDQESHLIAWLQLVRTWRDAPTRHGRFWLTGFRSRPLCYTVHACYDDGAPYDLIECTSPGCAIKHALSLFADEAVHSVYIAANRPGVSYTIGRDATMATLAEFAWPVA